MLSKYKIRIIKKYDLELDGKSEQDVREQVDYVVKHPNILEMSDIRKSTKIKIKKNRERSIYNNERNN